MARISWGVTDYSISAGVVDLQSVSYHRTVQWYLDNVYVGETYSDAGYTTTGWYNFTGLDPGTTYKISARIYKSSPWSELWSDYEYITTSGSKDTTAPTVTNLWSDIPSHGWVNKSKVAFSAKIYDYGSGIKSVQCSFNGQSQVSYGGYNGEYVFYFDTPIVAKDYTVSWDARDNNNNVTRGIANTYWIGSDTGNPYFNVLSADFTGNGIDVSCTAGDSLSGVSTIVYKISPPNNNNSFGQRVEFDYGSNNTRTYMFDANGNPLQPNKTYYIEYTVFDRAGNYTKEVKSCYVKYTRPVQWNWTQTEINAFKNRGEITNLTWQRWNAFIDNVIKVVGWYNDTQNDFLNLESAKMNSSKKILLAIDFNKIKNAIGSIVPTGITDRKKGDKVLGDYFITLSTKLNTIQK